MILTDSQWQKVGRLLKTHKGVKEIVIDKDLYGNAKVQFIGPDGDVIVRSFKGNVVQFPVKYIPEPEPENNNRTKFHHFMSKAKEKIVVFLGIDEDEGVDGGAYEG